jgi:ribonuclease Z
MTIEFLGTSSAVPTKSRNVSSLLLHCDQTSLMFDCGDGTLRQLRSSPISRPARIGAIFLTHLHCDHFYGLPSVAIGLSEEADKEITGRSNANECRPVYSPVGLERRMGNLLYKHLTVKEFGVSKMSKTGKNYDNTLPFKDHIIYEDNTVQIAAFFIHHSIQSAGYIVREKPHMKLDVGLLQATYKIPPGILYGKLQRMENVDYEGRTIYAKDVCKEAPGRTVVILGDTCNPTGIAPYIMDCDVLVHEATGLECDKAFILQTYHSTGTMAGEFAKSVRAKHLILNHFSPRASIRGVPCDDATYQKHGLREAKEAAGPNVLVTAAYDHLAIPIPKRATF